MKKNIFRIAALLMAGSLLVLACKKTDTPSNNGNNNNQEQNNGENNGENNGNNQEENKVEPVAIKLDASFSDWDAITEEVAKKNEYVAMYKSSDADDPIQVLKISSDQDKVYFFIEFNSDGLPQNASCSEWGDSMNGTPELGYKTPDAAHPDDDTFRETVFLFIDPDGDDKTGFYTFEGEDGNPTIGDMGCEMGVCWFAFFNYETKKVSMAWNQNNVGPTKLCKAESGEVIGDPFGTYDYTGTFFLSWPDSGEEAAWPLWGWLNFDDSGNGDNIAPSKDNWFPGVAEGTVAKLEFAVEKKDITNLKDEDEEYCIGITVQWGSVEQHVGPLRATYAQ